MSGAAGSRRAEMSQGRGATTLTDRALDLFEVARIAASRHDLPEELRGPLRAESDETVNLASFPYGCHVCEVEVDPDTGFTEIVRYSAVDDVGRAVNPMIVHGQVHGGILQGVGQAMREQVVYDRYSGQLLTGTWTEYAVPHADQAATSIETVIVEVPSVHGPFGARGVGEPPVIPTAGAVANAITDATGKRPLDLPIRPITLRNLLVEKEQV